MTSVCTPAPGAQSMAPSSPVSRPSPPGGLRPALTPAPGGTGWQLPGAGKEDQKSKIRLTEVSTVWGDCHVGLSSPVGRRAALSPRGGAGVDVGRWRVGWVGCLRPR